VVFPLKKSGISLWMKRCGFKNPLSATSFIKDRFWVLGSMFWEKQNSLWLIIAVPINVIASPEGARQSLLK